MKNLHIPNSYNIWKPSKMKSIIKKMCSENYNSSNPEKTLGRTYEILYVEWWLHNIGYYLTKPLCFNESIEKLNVRFRDVDLEEWR